MLSANLERERDDTDIATLVKRNQAEVEAIFENALRNAQRSGELGAAKDPSALASFFLATIQGMRSTARASSDRAALEHIARVALSTLDEDWLMDENPGATSAVLMRFLSAGGGSSR